MNPLPIETAPVVECPDCGWTLATHSNPFAVLNTHRPHCKPRPQRPATPTTTQEKQPMETPPRRPALEVLVDHDDAKIARLAKKAYDANKALQDAWDDYTGKAAARAKVARLEKELAAAKAELRGGKKPAAKAELRGGKRPAAKVDYKAVRAWAEANGHTVPRTGRISAEIVDAYNQATAGGAA